MIDVVGKSIAEIQSVTTKYYGFPVGAIDLAKFDLKFTWKLLFFLEIVIEEGTEFMFIRPTAHYLGKIPSSSVVQIDPHPACDLK